jgi:hypothetical protein
MGLLTSCPGRYQQRLDRYEIPRVQVILALQDGQDALRVARMSVPLGVPLVLGPTLAGPVADPGIVNQGRRNRCDELPHEKPPLPCYRCC